MSYFDSFSESVADILENPYTTDNKVKLKVTASNGVSFKPSFAVGPAGKTKSALNVTGKHGDLTVDKLEVSSEKKVEGTFSFANMFPKTDVGFKFTDGSKSVGAATTAAVSAKIAGGDLGKIDVEVDPLSGPTFNLSLVKDVSGYFFGVKAKVAAAAWGVEEKKEEAKGVAIAGVNTSFGGAIVGYNGPDFTAFLQSSACLKSYKFGVKQIASPSLTTAIALTYSCTDAPAVSFGGAYKIDDKTSVIAAVSQDAKVSVAYSQQLTANASVTLNGQFDVPKLSSGGQKFGLTLDLSN